MKNDIFGGMLVLWGAILFMIYFITFCGKVAGYYISGKKSENPYQEFLDEPWVKSCARVFMCCSIVGIFVLLITHDLIFSLLLGLISCFVIIPGYKDGVINKMVNFFLSDLLVGVPAWVVATFIKIFFMTKAGKIISLITTLAFIFSSVSKLAGFSLANRNWILFIFLILVTGIAILKKILK